MLEREKSPEGITLEIVEERRHRASFPQAIGWQTRFFHETFLPAGCSLITSHGDTVARGSLMQPDIQIGETDGITWLFAGGIFFKNSEFATARCPELKILRSKGFTLHDTAPLILVALCYRATASFTYLAASMDPAVEVMNTARTWGKFKRADCTVDNIRKDFEKLRDVLHLGYRKI